MDTIKINYCLFSNDDVNFDIYFYYNNFYIGFYSELGSKIFINGFRFKREPLEYQEMVIEKISKYLNEIGLNIN